MFKNQLNNAEDRRNYKKENYFYELNRSYYYRSLKDKILSNQNINHSDLKDYLVKYW